MDEEKGYEVVDKRGGNAETEREQTGEEPQQKQQEEQAGASEAPDVYAVLGFFASMLIENAWVSLGIRMDPISHTMKKDLAQARVAIDTLVFLSDKLAPKMEEKDRRDLRNMISDLQLNFVQQSAKGE